MIVAESTPRQKQSPQTAAQTQPAEAWRVVVLNDPVNRMSYVVMVLRRVFGFDEPRARQHMLQVHEQGRSIVWTGTREQAEAHLFSLHQWHLTAIIQADETS
ncbi:ATP-dependent Clp protease adapter protein ClpS [Lacunisphaera limnophila]|uniref:ATP-dependent Clp protease adapter protein ClpS n=1 Tax=Lacunisphaera limnophila TaxID=1838286 RepID=A0A1D8AY39_9BACT|nr:ATP-dependent Clp protease adaptor ClpS [Lacunisphaera limnophila]AOS45800.1 ATP-dependent Clp protease adapter protein ClpS [Lacunisphaera limnophila]